LIGPTISTPPRKIPSNLCTSKPHIHTIIMPTRKPLCDYKKETPEKCTSQAQRIVGDCGFCLGHFCSKHRLLESHSCPKLEDCKKESYEQNAIKLISERTVAIKGV